MVALWLKSKLIVAICESWKEYNVGRYCIVLYGCETLSLTLMEEHRLKVFENRVLRRIYGA
jgi:hypothetical protein